MTVTEWITRASDILSQEYGVDSKLSIQVGCALWTRYRILREEMEPEEAVRLHMETDEILFDPDGDVS